MQIPGVGFSLNDKTLRRSSNSVNDRLPRSVYLHQRIYYDDEHDDYNDGFDVTME